MSTNASNIRASRHLSVLLFPFAGDFFRGFLLVLVAVPDFLVDFTDEFRHFGGGLERAAEADTRGGCRAGLRPKDCRCLRGEITQMRFLWRSAKSRRRLSVVASSPFWYFSSTASLG